MSERRKRKLLPISEKLSIIHQIENNVSRKQISSVYSIRTSTITAIVQSKDKLLKAASSNLNLSIKRVRDSPFEFINKQVLMFINDAKAHGLVVNGEVVRRKALLIAEEMGVEGFSASSGWITNLRKKFKINSKNNPIEFDKMIVSQTDKWNQSLSDLLKNHDPSNIYSMESTSLLYDCLPDSNLSLIIDKIKLDQKINDKVTLVVSSNITGSDKGELWVIGKKKLLKLTKILKNQSLSLIYRSNKEAQLNESVFIEWIQAFDAKMMDKGKNALLLVNTCATFPAANYFSLKATKLVFYPLLFPRENKPLSKVLDNLKYFYRNELVNNYAYSISQNLPYPPVDIIEVIVKLSKLWTNKISPLAIEQCFDKAGFESAGSALPQTLDQEDTWDKSNFPLPTTNQNPFNLPVSVNWNIIQDHCSLGLSFTEFVNLDNVISVFPKVSVEKLMDRSYLN